LVKNLLTAYKRSLATHNLAGKDAATCHIT
jgi:hypothetical protein